MSRRSPLPWPPQPMRATRTRRFAPATRSCDCADSTDEAEVAAPKVAAAPAADWARKRRREGGRVIKRSGERPSHRAVRAHGPAYAACASRCKSSDAVPPQGACSARPRRGERPHGSHPVAVLGLETADRPVRSEHQPRRSEGLDREVHVRPDDVDVPGRVAYLGDHARQLAGHVRSLGDLPEGSRPCVVDTPRRDCRLGDVIQHERLRRVTIHERDGRWQLRGVDEDVVHETMAPQSTHAAIERGPGQECRIGLALHDMAYTDEPRPRRIAAQHRVDIVGREVRPSDNAPNPSARRRSLVEQEVVLGQRLPRLDGDGPVQPRGRQLTRQILVQVAAAQRCSLLVDPCVLDRIETPEVLVRVDLHGATAYTPTACRLQAKPEVTAPALLSS